MPEVQDERDVALFPDDTRHPYYIVAPPYTRFSAGVKSLHLLCHSLNRRGYQAYMVIDPDVPVGVAALSPSLTTPRLTQDLAEAHQRDGRRPIVVYPEVIPGNPMNAPVVVRYVLNFPGLLGGDKTYAPEEIVFGYSAVLAEAAGCPENVLFIPTSNSRIFHPPQAESARSGTCFYAKKYKLLHPNSLLPQTRESLEITTEQSPEEMAAIFSRSELIYCYENTAVALEAALCGCPAVFLPNQHLSSIIGAQELGADGFAWGDDPAEIARAKETVSRVFENYRATEALFWKQLDYFIFMTQKSVGVHFSRMRITPPFPKFNLVNIKISLFISRVRSAFWKYGLINVILKIKTKIKIFMFRRGV
ncbi:hypothetical protein GALL_253300 [mine drainage metagenome]|uniref:Uncharacterized protein n=1 Tax=mine drainage metagenome TaxID=410659 RepID=A0A1J5RL66_9ZZZZ